MGSEMTSFVGDPLGHKFTIPIYFDLFDFAIFHWSQLEKNTWENLVKCRTRIKSKSLNHFSNNMHTHHTHTVAHTHTLSLLLTHSFKQTTFKLSISLRFTLTFTQENTYTLLYERHSLSDSLSHTHFCK